MDNGNGPRPQELLAYVLDRVRAGDFTTSGPFRLVFDCPLPGCKSSRKPHHLYVNRDWFGYRCYRSGLYGSFKDVVLENPGLWWPIRSVVDSSSGVRDGAEGLLHGLESLSAVEDLSPGVSPAFRRVAYDYLLSRGMSPAQIKQYRVSLRPFDRRVYFPHWSERTVDYAVGRWIGDPVPEGVLKTVDYGVKPLYGLHVIEPTELLLAVEGVFDHFATPASMATMGSFIAPSQVKTLVELFRTGQIDRLALVRDPDAKDKARAEAAIVRRAGVPAVAAFIEGIDDDPGKLGPGVMSKVHRSLLERPARLFRTDTALSVSVQRTGTVTRLRG